MVFKRIRRNFNIEYTKREFFERPGASDVHAGNSSDGGRIMIM